MKKFSLIVATAVITLSSFAVNAGSAPNVDRILQEKMDCYRAHHKIMDKLSLQTLGACWKAHHQLMK